MSGRARRARKPRTCASSDRATRSRNGQLAGVLYSGTVPRRLPGGEERPDWQAPRPPGRWQGHRTRARAHLPLSLSRTRKAGDPGTRSPALHFFPPESCHRRWFALGGVRKQESYIAWSLPLCRRAVGEWAQPLPGRSVTLADRVQSVSASARCKVGACHVTRCGERVTWRTPRTFHRVCRVHPGWLPAGRTRAGAEGVTRRTQASDRAGAGHRSQNPIRGDEPCRTDGSNTGLTRPKSQPP
jgi:hypothetical protein